MPDEIAVERLRNFSGEMLAEEALIQLGVVPETGGNSYPSAPREYGPRCGYVSADRS